MTDPNTMLSAARSEQIFVDHIAPTILAAGEARKRPVAVVLSAQPGAGKTHLARLLTDQFADRGGAARIDVDTFKEFYPRYRHLQAQDEIGADERAKPDARRWLDRSLDYLTDRRVNIIVEHGLRDPEVTAAVLHRLDQAGYRIEAALMATPAALSRLSILERYQVGREKTGLGRYVTEELHDQRYAHLLNVADWLDADPRITAIAIYQRDGARVHHNERDSAGSWHSTAATREAMQQARNQPWSLNASEVFLRLHDSLAARMEPQWRTALDNARAAAAPMLHPDASQGPTRAREAVTYGRYQIVSIAHLDTIRTMLREWPRVTIGVIDLDAKPAAPLQVPEDLVEFYRVAEANTAAARNPMSTDERMALWQAAAETAGIADRVTIAVIPMPESDPTAFNRRFPPDQYDVVFPAASDAELPHADRARILARSISSVEPPLEFHTSTIRASYREGTDVWRTALAPGTLDTFVAADGPRRLLSLDSSQSQPSNDPAAPAQLARQSHPQMLDQILATDPSSDTAGAEQRARDADRRSPNHDIDRPTEPEER